MGKHTVAEAREKLPELIERARSGEDVLITRDGNVVAELRALPGASENSLEWLRANRPKRLAHTIDAVALVRAMRDEGEH
jgi:antitoxin (DNA-binding transcriptional repressor) of toxin-antitoxin stability system